MAATAAAPPRLAMKALRSISMHTSSERNERSALRVTMQWKHEPVRSAKSRAPEPSESLMEREASAERPDAALTAAEPADYAAGPPNHSSTPMPDTPSSRGEIT